ncbi:MAG TPA: hypothetical protein VLE47_01390 [Candidatus Saccharimonadales bacterium]|nr:hypothetical protein [Candidatus Saccharimonadales bacterium]
MNIQELFYLVAIFFMVYLVAISLVVGVLLIRSLNSLQKMLYLARKIMYRFYKLPENLEVGVLRSLVTLKQLFLGKEVKTHG